MIGIIGAGGRRPVPGGDGVGEEIRIDGRIRAARICQISQLFDGGKAPVRIPAKMRAIHRVDESFGIHAIARGSGIAAVGVRVAVIPGVRIVGVIGVIIMADAIHVPLYFPDQAGDIVFYHDPCSGGFRQGMAAAIELGISAWL